MINIAWTAKGVFSLKPGQADAVLIQASTTVLNSAMYEWATGVGPVATHLKDRMAPTAFTVYGFTKRSAKYQTKQMKAHGIIRPYFSPRRIDISALLVGTLKGNLQMVLSQAQRMSKAPHMANLITKPGIGFTLTTKARARLVTVKITYPGARALNAGGAKNAIYRTELADWSKGGSRDAKAVIARAQQVFSDAFEKQAKLIPTRKLA